MNARSLLPEVEAFARAVKAAGGQVRIAQALGCSQPRVSRILSGDSKIDAEMAAKIHAEGWAARWELRPDIFEEPLPVIEHRAGRLTTHEELERAQSELEQQLTRRVIARKEA